MEQRFPDVNYRCRYVGSRSGKLLKFSRNFRFLELYCITFSVLRYFHDDLRNRVKDSVSNVILTINCAFNYHDNNVLTELWDLFNRTNELM